MSATPATLDLTYAGLKPSGKPEIDPQGRPPHKQGGRPIKSDKPKAIRARARRRQKIIEEDLNKLYKPIEEWDSEELARGRPRAKDGSFSGTPPAYVTRAMHEQIIRRFETVVKEEMNTMTVEALTVLGKVMGDDSTDMKGKPLVPANTKVDVAKFLIEHVIGKPKQHTQTDISVKLQSVLGMAMANPGGELTQGSRPVEEFIDVDLEDVEEAEVVRPGRAGDSDEDDGGWD